MRQSVDGDQDDTGNGGFGKVAVDNTEDPFPVIAKKIAKRHETCHPDAGSRVGEQREGAVFQA